MQVLRDRLINTPIMSLQTGAQIAATTQPIIDPKNLYIAAFYCEGETVDFTPAILYTSDVREFGRLGMIVNSSSDIMSPDDLVRLQDILQRKFTLAGAHVRTDTGQKLGKVTDYSVDVDSFFIIKLYVQPPLLQSLSGERIIDRSQIVDIQDNTIIVHDNMQKIPAENQTQTTPTAKITNPFRHPQPETSDTKQA